MQQLQPSVHACCIRVCVPMRVYVCLCMSPAPEVHAHTHTHTHRETLTRCAHMATRCSRFRSACCLRLPAKPTKTCLPPPPSLPLIIKRIDGWFSYFNCKLFDFVRSTQKVAGSHCAVVASTCLWSELNASATMIRGEGKMGIDPGFGYYTPGRAMRSL